MPLISLHKAYMFVSTFNVGTVTDFPLNYSPMIAFGWLENYPFSSSSIIVRHFPTVNFDCQRVWENSDQIE